MLCLPLSCPLSLPLYQSICLSLSLSLSLSLDWLLIDLSIHSIDIYSNSSLIEEPACTDLALPRASDSVKSLSWCTQILPVLLVTVQNSTLTRWLQGHQRGPAVGGGEQTATLMLKECPSHSGWSGRQQGPNQALNDLLSSNQSRETHLEGGASEGTISTRVWGSSPRRTVMLFIEDDLRV